MDFVNVTPLKVGFLAWDSAAGQTHLTVICKATFRLTPGQLTLHAEQEDINEEDNYWDDDPNRSLHSPTDLVPFKQGVDIMLVGCAFAPANAGASSVLVRMAVGSVDRKVVVAGIPSHGSSGSNGAAPLVVTPLLHVKPPAGLGPVAPRWPERAKRLGTKLSGPSTWTTLPLPMGLDPACFNAAPEDQRLAELHGSEAILLENLHPEHARLVTKLPSLAPQAFLEVGQTAPTEVSLRLDTLWIDTDRSLCTLVWRGSAAVASPSGAGRAIVCLPEVGRPMHWADVQRLLAHARAEGSSSTLNVRAEEAERPALPFSSGALVDALSRARQLSQRNDGQEPAGETILVGGESSREKTMPFLKNDAAPQAAPPVQSPWAHGLAKEERALPLFAVSTPEYVASPPLVLEQGPGKAETVSDESSPWRRAGRRKLGGGHQEADGLLAVSNAAAAVENVWAERRPAEPAEAKRAPDPVKSRPVHREVIELLWFDAAAVSRMRRVPSWRKIVGNVKAKAREDSENDGSGDKRQEVKDRRDVLLILKEGEPIDAQGADAALEDAVVEGVLTPPLVVVAGQLEMSLDSVEALKATVAVVSPFGSADKKLEEAVEAAKQMLGSPSIQGAGALCEAMASRVKDAFGEGKRALPAGYLEGHVERMLLEERHYQKRKVMGQPWLRGVLSAAGGEVVAVAYLPVSLADDLPMFRRFEVRVVGELKMRVDQYEACQRALRVMALARMELLGGGR